MPRFFFETDAKEHMPLQFAAPPDVIAAFLSFAFATRYGAQHPFSQLSLHLRAQHKIDLAPLANFAGRDVQDEDDRRDLDAAWQHAAPLADTLARVVDALDAPDTRTRALIADEPDLLPRLRELRDMAAWATARGARARLTYEL